VGDHQQPAHAGIGAGLGDVRGDRLAGGESGESRGRRPHRPGQLAGLAAAPRDLPAGQQQRGKRHDAGVAGHGGVQPRRVAGEAVDIAQPPLVQPNTPATPKVFSSKVALSGLTTRPCSGAAARAACAIVTYAFLPAVERADERARAVTGSWSRAGVACRTHQIHLQHCKNSTGM